MWFHKRWSIIKQRKKYIKMQPIVGNTVRTLIVSKIQSVLTIHTFIWSLWGIGFPRPAQISTTKECDAPPGVHKHQPGPSSTCEVPLPYVLLSFRHPCKCYTISSVGPGGILQPYTTQRSLIHPPHTRSSLSLPALPYLNPLGCITQAEHSVFSTHIKGTLSFHAYSPLKCTYISSMLF